MKKYLIKAMLYDKKAGVTFPVTCEYKANSEQEAKDKFKKDWNKTIEFVKVEATEIKIIGIDLAPEPQNKTKELNRLKKQNEKLKECIIKTQAFYAGKENGTIVLPYIPAQETKR